MAAKPRLVLLDAGAVIHAHRCNGWALLCARYEVVVPSIVAGEAAFFKDSDGQRVPIDLEPDFVNGHIQRYEATVSDTAQTMSALPKELRGRVHDGELEALTYLRVNGTKDLAFLSGDGGAIEATVVLGISDVAMSLQRALQLCGVTKALPREHTEEFIAEAKRRGGSTLAQFGMLP